MFATASPSVGAPQRTLAEIFIRHKRAEAAIVMVMVVVGIMKKDDDADDGVVIRDDVMRIIISLDFIMYCKDNTSAYYATQKMREILSFDYYICPIKSYQRDTGSV